MVADYFKVPKLCIGRLWGMCQVQRGVGSGHTGAGRRERRRGEGLLISTMDLPAGTREAQPY